MRVPLQAKTSGYSMKAKGARQAEILIYEDVGDGWFGGVSAKRFADDLKKLGALDSIDLRINSYGGDVFDGLAIYRQLVDHSARVVTHVDGVAASIASIIAMAGDEIRISEAGFMMIHDAWGMSVGNAVEMRQYADRLEAVTEQLANVYVARTGNTADQVRAWMAEESWFNAADAVTNGFASSVVENQKMAARLDPERHKFRQPPLALNNQAQRTNRCPELDAVVARIAAGRMKLQTRGA
jgi:ATP-dependent Clp protease, protease subunit